MGVAPLYLQVRQAILSDIMSGNFLPGCPIPSEMELCTQFGVSRITVRKAIESLAEEGMVQKVHGVGTFVRDAITDGQKLRFRGYLDDVLSSDPEIKVTLQGTTQGTLPERVAQLFLIDAGTIVDMNLMVLHRKGKPIMVGRRFIPADLLQREVGADIQPHEQPTVTMFKQVGVLIGRGEQHMHAVCADESSTRLLGVPLGTPLIASWRIYFDRQERPITALDTIYHPKNFEMSVDLIPRAGGRFI